MAAVRWKSPVSGDWTDAADWSTGTVPVAGDDVTIAHIGAYTVSLTIPVTVRSITISGPAATLAITDPGKIDTVSGDLGDSGRIEIDASGGGGSTLKVGGTLSVIANTGILDIGNTAITRPTTVTAAALDNTNSIAIAGGQASAELYVASAAPATLNGRFQLTGNALLKYASGGITTIGSGGEISLDGAHAVAAVRGLTGSNSALAGLTENNGDLLLADGARLALAGSLTNTGALALDATGVGGGRLIIGGMLTADASWYSGTGVGALAGSGEIRADGSADTLNGLTIGAGTTIAADSSALTVYGLVVKGTLTGRGAPTLEFGRLGADNMTNIAGFGTIGLADGGENRLTLINANLAGTGGAVTINDGDSGNIVDASALTSGFSIVVHAGQGADVLRGGGGNDRFYAYGGNQPGGGNTMMTGRAGNNRFVFTAPGPTWATPNNNVITDFAASAGNGIVLSNSGFALGLSGAGSTPQALPNDLFVANATGSFTNTTQRFAYDTGNGDLYYNAAGSGGASGSDHLIAQLAHDPGLAASQLFFIS